MIDAQSPSLILGSSSPRRRALLERIGIRLCVVSPEVEESRRAGESPTEYVNRNAKEKGLWVGAQPSTPDGVLLSADTIVVVGDQVLEKPRDHDDACAMLNKLSGRCHTVVSGVFLGQFRGHDPYKEAHLTVRTEVEIKQLSNAEISAYVLTGEPMDKAGSYAVQGIGAYMVRAIRGSYTNVVGLPLSEVVESLVETFAYPVFSFSKTTAAMSDRLY